MNRYSSRRRRLDAGFPDARLAGPRSYDRIAGYTLFVIDPGTVEQARHTIDAVPRQHPFDLRYRRDLSHVDWESCARVLDDAARRQALARGWQDR